YAFHIPTSKFLIALLREFLSQLHPFALRRELLIRAPVRAGFLRQPHLLEGDREVEVRIGVERVQPQRFAIAGLRFRNGADVAVDIAEIEVGLEEVGLEADRALVEGLRLRELVA